MSQYGDFDQAIAGLKYGEDSDVKSFVSKQIAGIAFGLPLFGYEGNDNDVFAFRQNISAMTFDGDFTAGDVITLTVDGVALTPVTYAASHAATLAALVVVVEAEVTGSTATGVTRTITIEVEDGVNRAVTETVVGGTEATGTEVLSSGMIFKGGALFIQKEAAETVDLDGNVLNAATADYELNSSVNGMVEGWMWFETDGNADSGMPVYVIASGANQGKLTHTVGSNVLINGLTFDITANTANLAGVRLKN